MLDPNQGFSPSPTACRSRRSQAYRSSQAEGCGWLDYNHVVQSHAVPFVFGNYELLGSFESIDTLLPEPFGEVGPQDPDLLKTPQHITDAYPLELRIVKFNTGG